MLLNDDGPRSGPFSLVRGAFAATGCKNPRARILEAMHAEPSLMAMQFLVGAACSVLGGYVAARIAKRDEILNTAVSSFLCVGMEPYAMLPPKRQWFNRLAR